MPALSIQPPYPAFAGTDGLPLENGYIWIGTVNLNPQVNPIAVYWDAALTIPAAQPIRTLNGYPAYQGTPARLYVNSDYSIQVLNSKGSLVYSAPAATERYSDVVISINAQSVVYDPPFSGSAQTNVEAKLAQYVSVKDFGAVGDGITDDTTAIQAAIAASKALYWPTGTYNLSSSITLSGNSIAWFGDGYENSVINLTGSASITFTGNRNTFSELNFKANLTSSTTPFVLGVTAGTAFWDSSINNCKFQGNPNTNAQSLMSLDNAYINTFTSCMIFFGGTVVDINTIGGRNTFQGCSIRATQDANNDQLIKHVAGESNYFIGCDIETCTLIVNVSGGLVNFQNCYFEAALRRADNDLSTSAILSGGMSTFDSCYISNMIFSVYTAAAIVFKSNYFLKAASPLALYFREVTLPYMHIEGNFVTPQSSASVGLFMRVGSPTVIQYTTNGGTTFATATVTNYCYVNQERCRDVNTASFIKFMYANNEYVGMPNTKEIRIGSTSVGGIVSTKQFKSFGSEWDSNPLALGNYFFWVDATGDFRIKSGAPTSDTDGTVVGTQT